MSASQLSIAVLATLAGHDPQDHVVAHGIAPIFPKWNLPLEPVFDGMSSFWFTNHLLMTLVAAGVMILIFIPMGLRYAAAVAGVPVTESVPRGFTALVEGMMDALRSGVVKPVLGDNTDRFMPFLWTVFFFILINNLLGMVPLEPVFKLFLGMEHIGGTATGNVNVTAGLALCAFAAIHFSGIRELYQALRAGTYGHGHHHEHDEHTMEDHVIKGAVADPHGAHAAEGKYVPPTRGLSPVLAFPAALGLYAWNFAPHAFQVAHARPKPGAGKRLVMLVVYVAILFGEYHALGLLVGGAPGAAVLQWVGATLGVAYALTARGLHPLDFADVLMWGFLFLLECIGALVKPFALCIRLFANMIAGHIVLGSILLVIPVFHGLTVGYLAGSLAPVIGCVLLSCLELFVAFLQAYIFMFLTAMFIGAAVHPEH